MTKTYCDICGNEIKPNTIWANVYTIKMYPVVPNSNTSSDMDFGYDEVCYDCASEIAENIRAMKRSS